MEILVCIGSPALLDCEKKEEEEKTKFCKVSFCLLSQLSREKKEKKKLKKKNKSDSKSVKGHLDMNLLFYFRF